MSHPSFAALVTVIACLAPAPTSAQSQAPSEADTVTWAPPRTPDGRPDLQGFWTTQTFTPLERPEYLAGKEFFTEEEAAALHQQFTAEGVDPSARDAINLEDAEAREKRLYQTNREATYIHYDNEIWLRTPVPKGLSSRRTSLITDPPNGRVPPLTPEARQRTADAAQARRQRGAFDGYEARPLSERCIVWPHNGPPMLPTAYNDIHQIFQTPDYVVVHTELSNNIPRIIPLDGRPHISDDIASSRETHVAVGRARRLSSRPETSPTRRASKDPARRCAWWNASRASTQHDPLSVHGRRSDLLDERVERGDSDGEDRGSAVRVRVSRG